MSNTEEPLIRVVVPTRNEDARTLRVCTEAIASSRHSAEMEMVVVDDGIQLQLNHVLAGLSVHVVSTNGLGSAAAARNAGAAGFTGKVLVFIDADVRVEPAAISRLCAPILDGHAAATVGCYTRPTKGMSFATAYKYAYLETIYSCRKHRLRNEFWTALGAVDAETFARLNGFDENFTGACSEDTEFGQRLTAAKQEIVSVPEAVGKHLRRFTLAGLFANDFRKAIGSSKTLLRGRTPVRDFRHSSRHDMVAVALSGLCIVGIPLLLLPMPIGAGPSPFAAALLIASYLTARYELASVFARAGPFFLLRALPIMFALDLVRGLCFCYVYCETTWHRLLARRRPAIE